ncbi:Bacterial extracellular solute-binding protein, family 3 [Pseudodesulfovibrio hydrargyri]|uniref:Bacterial extracellular solute-binding protein, family 3 n=1 Tax=Pseudodesulfovibrio hydrargyri TaxID=2125990 RepID=A0A1J5N8Y8_9BACT|nr:transporter substrate-binding domain-containing protein [Pseudodesulfovibrio hydrargyri]OIQ51280.1 Bacterial extracellular solute-binding protein, family 3 [Pseudodesulfovibrio hydrargyri]
MGIYKIKCVLLALCLWSFVALLSAEPALADHVQFYVDALPPYAVLHDDGPPTGFAVALMERLMRTAGEHFDATDVAVMTWARAVHHVEVVPHAALLVLTKLPERADRYKWVGPLDLLPVGVIARRDSGVVVERLEDLLKYRVGIVRNTAPYRVLIRDLPEVGPNLVLLSGIPALLRMLRERRVDVIVQADRASRELMRGEGMDADEYATIFHLAPLAVYFGFNKSTDDGLIHRLQSALDRFKEPDSSGVSPYSRMREAYFGRPAPGVEEKKAE